MSVTIMSEVFKRYPNGGGEMVLALAIADHAHDDGSHIFPSVKKLAEKSRQSERTVQYQLRKMQESGWIVLVADEKGGRGRSREYKINEDWIKGAEIAPIEKGANQRIKGAISGKKGAIHDIKGAIAVAPESSITIKNHQEPLKENNKKKKENPIRDLLPEISEQTFNDFVAHRKNKKALITETAVKGFRREAGKANISLETALIETIERGWIGFKSEWYQNANAPPVTGNKQNYATEQSNRTDHSGQSTVSAA